MSGLAKIEVISCPHCPFMPPETKDWVLNTLSNMEGLTHFGHLGDLHEASAGSVHPNEYTHTLEDEYYHSHNLLSSLRAVLPSSCASIQPVAERGHKCRSDRGSDAHALTHQAARPELLCSGLCGCVGLRQSTGCVAHGSARWRASHTMHIGTNVNLNRPGDTGADIETANAFTPRQNERRFHSVQVVTTSA